MRHFVLALLLTWIVLPLSASANQREAESCLRGEVWDGYVEGWYNQSLRSSQLDRGGARHFMVTLEKGREYLFRGCGDQGISNVDLMVYDTSGKVLVRNYGEAEHAMVYYTPKETRAYYVVIHAREVGKRTEHSHVSLAVTYR